MKRWRHAKDRVVGDASRKILVGPPGDLPARRLQRHRRHRLRILMATAAWSIQTPAQLQLVGPSQAGKSVWINKLLSDDERVFDVAFKQIWYASPYARSRDADYVALLYEACQKSGKRLHTGDTLPTAEQMRQVFPHDPVLFIADDLLCFEDCASLTELSSMHAHHQAISCIYVVQNPFQRTKKLDLTTVSRNLTGRVLFYQTNDYNIYSLLNSRIFPEKKHFISGCMEGARQLGYSYVFLNTHPRCKLPRRYLAYTAILKQERESNGGSPLFFDLETGSNRPAPAVDSQHSRQQSKQDHVGKQKNKKTGQNQSHD